VAVAHCHAHGLGKAAVAYSVIRGQVSSLQEIAEEERRWEFATTTPGMTPIQALELVRGFARAIQESTPETQREVVQRVFQRIAITDDRVTDVDVYPVYAEALRWYWRPQPDEFRTPADFGNGRVASQRSISGHSADGGRTVDRRRSARSETRSSTTVDVEAWILQHR
jgi:hypothetical protein